MLLFAPMLGEDAPIFELLEFAAPAFAPDPAVELEFPALMFDEEPIDVSAGAVVICTRLPTDPARSTLDAFGAAETVYVFDPEDNV
jgi:hypothetical protein